MTKNDLINPIPLFHNGNNKYTVSTSSNGKLTFDADNDTLVLEKKLSPTKDKPINIASSTWVLDRTFENEWTGVVANIGICILLSSRGNYIGEIDDDMYSVCQMMHRAAILEQ